MKIEQDELMLALTSPHYKPSQVIVIVSTPIVDAWRCAYMPPEQAIAMLKHAESMGDQTGELPPAQWGDAVDKIVAKGQTAVVKYWWTSDRFVILLQAYETKRLHSLRSIVAPS